MNAVATLGCWAIMLSPIPLVGWILWDRRRQDARWRER